MYHISGRPSTENITILRGAPSPTYTPELIPNINNLFLICVRNLSQQWLQNGDPVAPNGSPNLRLDLSSTDTKRIYQCVGVVAGQPETDYTGEVGSDIYVLVPGMQIN